MKRLKLLSLIGRIMRLDTIIGAMFPGEGVEIKFYADDRDCLLIATGIILALSEKSENMDDVLPEILRNIANGIDAKTKEA